MEQKEDTRKPERDLGILILFFIILGVIWYAQGGPSRPPTSPFLNSNSTAPSIVGSSAGNQTNNKINSQATSSPSFDPTKITLRKGGAKESDPKKEYVEIKLASDSKVPVDITGWTLKSEVTRIGFQIPQAYDLYLLNQYNTAKNVVLSPGEKAIITTGLSPLSGSFHVNKCSGYFSQTKDFNPPLWRHCPWPKDEDWPASLSFDCLDYIDTLPPCTSNITHPYSLRDNDCISAINHRLSYNGCVEAHKNDKDFFDKEWRIYLGRSDEIWRPKHETITLYDKEGKKVDSVSY